MDILAVDRYSSELHNTRREINRINMQIAENRRAQVGANAERRRSLQLIAKRDAAEKAVLTAQAQRITLDRRAAIEAQRSYGERLKSLSEIEEASLSLNRSLQRNNKNFGILQRSLGAFAAGVATEIGARATHHIIQFSREAARASIQIDSYTRALEVLEGSALAAENRIRELQALADQPGLRFRAAVEGALALKAVRIEGELATRTLRELANAAAFTGGEGEFQRGLLGLRQIAARGRISQEELNQLTENISIASTVLRNEFGTVLAEDIQENLDETGQSVTDFIETLISGFEKLDRFPIDAPSVRLKNLSNSFFEFQAAIGDTFLPIVANAATGLTALFDALARGVTDFNNFFDVVDEQHQALLNASESAREFSIRLTDINEAAGQREAVAARIQSLYRLRSAYRTEQSQLSQSTQAYLEYAQQIRDVNNELDLLRNVQGTAQTDNRVQLIAVRTEALQRANADIERYTQLLANAREVAVGDTNPAIQQLERSLARSQATITSLNREIELLQNGFQDLVAPVETTAEAIVNASLAIARLRTESEDALAARNFSAALTASNAYYAARIANAQEALAAEMAGTQEYNDLETQIFELRRQRFQAEQRLEIERQNVVARTAQLRIETATRARSVEVQNFQSAAAAGESYAEALRSLDSITQRQSFDALVIRLQDQGQSFEDALTEAQQYIEVIGAISPTVSRADIEHGRFNETLGRTRTILDGLIDRQIAYSGAIGATLTLVRAFQRAVEDQNMRLEAGQSRTEQREQQVFLTPPTGRNLDEIRREAGEAGAEFLRQQFQQQERELARSLTRQYREYQRFYQSVSDLAVSAAFGQIESFTDAAKQFVIAATRDLVRLAIQRQVTAAKEIAIDTAVTNARIANQQRLLASIARTAAANQASAAGAGAGAGGIGLPNIGGLASGGAGALGLASLAFRGEFANLFSGIGVSLISPLVEAIGGSEANSISNLFIRFDDGTIRKIRDGGVRQTARNR